MLKEKNGYLGLPDLADGLSWDTGAKSLSKALTFANGKSFFQMGSKGCVQDWGKDSDQKGEPELNCLGRFLIQCLRGSG